jgi:hypothetical protein
MTSLCQMVQRVVVETNAWNSTDHSDSCWHSAVGTHRRLACPSALKVGWVRHSMADDGRL